MLEIIIARGNLVKFCGCCMYSRDLAELKVIKGCDVATMDDLALRVIIAIKLLLFNHYSI
ncbi:hypothetical protein swp_5152 [Shewanella piezotolerans WP3]|uniref:Uncharacterized protein n=1 Tax=Shewanella piezotolerans (strain WP3 / JCM 13877) TaxID=225849 RepID=B8CVU1_SHEPW|nr:hypothetical protein [Shewanella piezotolerans]ACJ31767.1 hypothetical protein swp_5152 [Shewanella piezotolerans WP3]